MLRLQTSNIKLFSNDKQHVIVNNSKYYMSILSLQLILSLH